jgi:hypothetical protein
VGLALEETDGQKFNSPSRNMTVDVRRDRAGETGEIEVK